MHRQQVPMTTQEQPTARAADGWESRNGSRQDHPAYRGTPLPDSQDYSANFAAIYGKYQRKLLASMLGLTRNRALAEDVTAAAFSVAFEQVQTFRQQSSIYTWLHAIAKNEVRRRWRRQSRDVALESADSALVTQDAVWDQLERSECQRKIRRTLQRLPRMYRRVLLDHVAAGLSIKRIAEIRRLPVGTVLSRLFTAKRLLRGAWEA